MDSKPSKKARKRKRAVNGMPEKPMFAKMIRDHLFDRRLAHVNRWGTTPTVKAKSVAQHSFYVGRIARRICEILAARRIETNKIDVLKVVDMALMHDEEEAASGDIVHTFKHYSGQLRNLVEETTTRLLDSEYSAIPNGAYFVEVWRNYREQDSNGNKPSVEAQIVQVADDIAGLAECEEEIRLGNTEFSKLAQNYVLLLGRITYPWFKAIQDTLTFRGV